MAQDDGGKFKAEDTDFSIWDSSGFDAWSRLARENPAEFELRRERVVLAAISKMTTDKESIQELSRRIDMERSKAGSPMEALRWMLEEMQRNVENLRDQSDKQVSHFSVLDKSRE